MRKKKHLKACHYAAPPRQYKPKTLTLPVEIVSLEDNSYHLIIPVKVNDTAGDMIIDTGASVTVVDEQVVAGIPGESAHLEMQSGSVTGQIQHVRLIKVPEFRIGDRKLKNLQLASIDLQYVNEMYHKHLNRKIIGLLGCDFCVKYRVIIDYRNKTLTMSL